MRKRLWQILGLIISLAIAAFLLRQLDPAAFVEMVARVPIWSLLAALVCYLLLNYFRVWRFTTLLGGDEIPFTLMYPIVLYHNFLVRTLPLKTGEISYVVLLRRHLQRPLREGVSSLVASRMFELFMVVVVGGGALLLASVNTVLTIELLLVIAVAIMFLVALYFSGSLLRWTAKRLPIERLPLLSMVGGRMDALAQAFDRLRVPGVYRSMLFWSVCTYSMSVSFNLVLLYGLGVDVNLGLLIGIISIVMLTDALPLATISGLGVVEGGWTFGLVVLAGLGSERAAAIAFFLHGAQILSAIITGLVGYVWLQQFSAPVTVEGKDVG